MSNTEVGYLFEELMNTNRELSQAYEELGVYKKALEMACGQVHRFEVLVNYGEGELSTDEWKEYFVKKAREENG